MSTPSTVQVDTPARLLDAGVRETIGPALSAMGFVGGRGRAFRRPGPTEGTIQIVDLQLGVRSMEGRFTANLAVYDPAHATEPVDPSKVREEHCHPARRQRLGYLVHRPRLRILARLPVIGVLGRPRDVWWSVRDALAYERVAEALVTTGVAWLEAASRPPGSLAPTGGAGGSRRTER